MHANRPNSESNFPPDPAMRTNAWARTGVFRILRCCYHWRKFRETFNPRGRDQEGPGLAILIHSFDGYKRFWGPAAWFAQQNLNCGYPIYFATEEKPFALDPFRVLLTGRGSFLARLKRAVLRLKKEGFRYLLYLQEDMWISEPQSREKLADLVNLMTEHRLDSLKLGKHAFWPWVADGPEIAAIRETREALHSERWPGEFTWFGSHDYALSHHPTIFDIDFLLETIQVALACGKVKAIDHESWVSDYLRNEVVACADDRKKYRIAVWRNRPIIPYAHACMAGKLSEEGLGLLRENGIEHLYDPEVEGDVFPISR